MSISLHIGHYWRGASDVQRCSMKRALPFLPLVCLSPLGNFLASYLDGAGILPRGSGFLISADISLDSPLQTRLSGHDIKQELTAALQKRASFRGHPYAQDSWLGAVLISRAALSTSGGAKSDFLSIQ